MSPAHRSIACALAAACTLAGATAARADDPPTVTIVPIEQRLELSRVLPAGTAFKVKLTVAKDVPIQGTIAIWPADVAPCRNQQTPDGALVFALGGDAATGELSAELPALQFGVSYCLRLDQRRGLTTIEANRAARPTVDQLDPILRTAPLEAGPLGVALAGALRQTLATNTIDITGITRPSLEELMAAVARDHVFSAPSHEYLAASALAETARTTSLQGALDAVEARADGHRAAIGDEAPIEASAPFLLVGDAWYTPKQFWSAPRAVSVLDEAQAYLRALRADPRVATAPVDEWLAALELAKTDFAAAKAIPLGGFGPGVIGVWDGEQLHPYAALLDGAQVRELGSAVLRRAAIHLREHDVQHKPNQTRKLQAALRAMADDLDRRARAEAEVTTAEARAAAARTAAHDGLVKLVSDALRDLRVAAAFASGSSSVPESTPQPSNHASLDLGLAVGLPFTEGGGDREALWMPYVGVNLYFHGVDRTIPLSRQRGGFWRTRFALTLGVSLDEPRLANRELQGFLFGKIPLVAVGGRVTQYTRLSAGLMFYEWPDDSPAEDDPDFGAAAFVGYSLDLDLVTWIRGNARGYGGL